MPEERIRIIKFLWPDCKDCGGKCTDTKFCKESQPGILKEKVIWLMAKEYYENFSGCAHITPFEKLEDKYKQAYCNRAEVMLNALLKEGL